MPIAVPDPRSTLRVRRENEPRALWAHVDGACVLDAVRDFDASAARIVRYPCGECGEWDCNSGTVAETLVHREGPYVFWLDGVDGSLAFDVDHYRAVLGGDPGDLQRLDAAALSRLRPHVTHEEAWAADGSEGHVAIDIDWDGVVPTLSFVRPPAACTLFRPLSGEDDVRRCIAAARVEGRVRAFFGDHGPLPAWVEGPAVEGMFAGAKLVEA